MVFSAILPLVMTGALSLSSIPQENDLAIADEPAAVRLCRTQNLDFIKCKFHRILFPYRPLCVLIKPTKVLITPIEVILYQIFVKRRFGDICTI